MFNDVILVEEMNPRRQYEEKCKEENRNFMEDGPLLVQYVRDDNNNPLGVVVAFGIEAENGKPRLMVGYSKCHTTLESFNKHVGLNKAIRKAGYPENVRPEVEQRFVVEKTRERMLDALDQMIGRGISYFKVG